MVYNSVDLSSNKLFKNCKHFINCNEIVIKLYSEIYHPLQITVNLFLLSYSKIKIVFDEKRKLNVY